MSTITDVAREAGVSVATVSRALRGLDRVSPDTRERVLQVAHELNYVASPTATSLASGRTRVIGVVVPFLTRWFFAAIVSAIEKSLRNHNLQVMLFDLEDDSLTSRLGLKREMLWKRVDGVIVVNIPLHEDEVDLLDLIEVPTVAISNPVAGRPLITIDDVSAARIATEHLIELGHRAIAYVGVVPANVVHEAVPRARLASFRETMAAHDLSVPDEWLLPSDWTAMHSHDHFAALLEAGHRPTAVLAASDEMAIGVIQAAVEAGLRVPEDLSVIGIDDYHLSDVLQLTTVRQDIEEQGRLAAELLMHALTTGQVLEPDEIVLPVELMVRRTTAPPSR